MAYDFLSAFHQNQWDALKAFTESTLKTLDPREVKDLKRKTLPYKGEALAFKVAQAERMLNQYQAAYRHVGGSWHPYYDRSANKKPVEGTKYADYGFTVEDGKPATLSFQTAPRHGTPNPGGLDTSPLVNAVKKFQLPEIKWKKERLEFRIKRIYDLIDRLYKELQLVEALWPAGSDKHLQIEEISQVDVQFGDPAHLTYNLFTGDENPFTERGAMKDMTKSVRDLFRTATNTSQKNTPPRG